MKDIVEVFQTRRSRKYVKKKKKNSLKALTHKKTSFRQLCPVFLD